ncbi:MAG: hypothetical protein ABMA64_11565 [Myxococcota bacterium]
MVPWLTPYMGLEWRPLSRGDLTWVSEGDTSGLGVASADGFARPQLMAYGGAWLTEHVGVHGALGVARVQTTTWVEDVYTQRHWGVVRPAVDARVSLLKRSDPRPVPWVLLGVHVDVPSARDTSNGYTEDEALGADQIATADRRRLGTIGGRAGLGVDFALRPELRIGAQWALDWQRSLFVDDDPATVSSWVAAEGALLLEFHWPRAR